MVARLLRTAAHSLFFMSCSVAIAPIKPDFVATELVFFMAVAAFMGAMVSSGDAMRNRASKRILCKALSQ